MSRRSCTCKSEECLRCNMSIHGAGIVEQEIFTPLDIFGTVVGKVRTVYCYLGLWSVKIRTMSAGTT